MNQTRILRTRRAGTAMAIIAALSVSACGDFDVPNYGAQSIGDLQSGANAAQFGAAAVGLLGLSRDFETSFLSSHVSLTGNFGREGAELDPSNPQHPTDRFDQIGTGEAGNAGWGVGYRLIKQGNVILTALGTATGMTDAQKEGVRGFTKTLQALALIRLLNVFDQAGLPIDVDIETSAPAAAIAAPPAVRDRIIQLLDQGQTHLQAAGATFSFTLPSGYTSATQGTSFGTPAAFLTFNRALKARIEAYRGSIAETAAPGSGVTNYTAALTALGASFLNTSASLRFGTYDTYRSATGDRPNPLYDPTCRQLFALTELETNAQHNGGPTGPIDARWTTKVQKIPQKTIHNYIVDACWRLYPSADAPIAVIRNEELILLRAEARWFTGDKVNALVDLDLVRTVSGGLQACGAVGSSCAVTIASTDAEFITELLYNRLYSLMWEGGHRWIDTRRFGRLGTLPKVLPRSGTFPPTKVFAYLPLPTDECLPRNNPAASCANPTPVP